MVEARERGRGERIWSRRESLVKMRERDRGECGKGEILRTGRESTVGRREFGEDERVWSKRESAVEARECRRGEGMR